MNSLVQLVCRSSILGFVSEIGDTIMNNITDIVGPILWGLCDIFFVILNIFEVLFRKLAGIGEGVETSTGEAIEGDLVLYLIQSNLVQQIFMSILVLSLVLLIIFTIFAIVKNQYAEKQESPTKIIGNSFKALLMYLMVPIATIVCLMVGNVILQAIDGATRTQTNGGSASDMLFITAAYNANKLRDDDINDSVTTLQLLYSVGALDKIEPELNAMGITDWDTAGMATPEQIEHIANLIDEHFVSDEGLSILGRFTSKWSYTSVSVYYDTFHISYIIVWVGGAFLIWSIGKICWGLVSRLFKMTLYFAISPAVLATYPIQGDKPLAAWRGEMVKLGTLAYSAVGVLNVLYSILPFFDNINLYGTFGAINPTMLAVSTPFSFIANQLIKLFIYIIAFNGASSLIDTIGGWFGLGNIISEGKSTKSAVTGQLKKAADKGVGTVSGAFAGMKAAKEHDGKAFSGFLTGALGGAGFKTPMSQFKDAAKKGKEAGEGLYKTAKTTDFKPIKKDSSTGKWQSNIKNFLQADDDKKKAYERFDELKAFDKQYKAMGGGAGAYTGGDSAEQEQLRSFLESTDMGKAFESINKKRLEGEKAIEENNKAFLEILEKVVKAREDSEKREKKLREEFNALKGVVAGASGSWETLSESQRSSEISTMLRDGVAGKNLDQLKDFASNYEDAKTSVEDAEKAVGKRMARDTKFNKFVKDSYYDANAGEVVYTDVKSKMATVETEIYRLGNEIEEERKKIAKAVQDVQYGVREMEKNEKDAWKNYNDSKPKS